MPATFAGKVAFVTGAGTGIGRAAAIALTEAGAKVALVGIEGKDLDETRKLIEDAGGEAVSIIADTSKSEEVQTALQKTIEAYGRLDIAFNNAGVEQHKAPLAELPEEEWNRIVDTDLRGTYFCMKYEIPLLLKQGGGAIVNTSSGAGLIGIKANGAYTAAKHGIVGLTRSAALDYAASGIRINAICPGYIETPMMDRFAKTPEQLEKVIEDEPIGRPGKPEEIAAAVLWLCSDAASFVIGHALAVDGGQVIH